MTRKESKSVRGTDLNVGDILFLSYPKRKVITSCAPGCHSLGAKYQDVVLEDGTYYRCWEGFNYHIEVDVSITLNNATPRELQELEYLSK